MAARTPFTKDRGMSGVQIFGRHSWRRRNSNFQTPFTMSPVIKRFKQWAITEDGLECLLLYYPIAKERFNESGRGWVAQIEEKTWADIVDFEEAFTEAKRHFKME